VKLTLLKIKFIVASVKHYGQACAIARALDVVGERWSLLLVRELLFGPRRYRDLAAGLPGIPSNVLAARLKDLQAAGVVARRTLPTPADVSVYELTGAGRALQPALNELLAWGVRYAPEPSPDDAIQPGWALLGATGRPTALPAGQACELRVGAERFYLGSEAGKLTVRRGPAPDGDAVVTMPAATFYSLLTGQVTVAGAVGQATVTGDAAVARQALEPLAAQHLRGRPPPCEVPGQNQPTPPRQQVNLREEPACPKHDPRPPARPRRAMWPRAARRAWPWWCWPPRS